MGFLSFLKFWNRAGCEQTVPIKEPPGVWRRKSPFKYCPRCGFNVANASGRCANCGYDLTKKRRRFEE